jgi:hypothetical protein
MIKLYRTQEQPSKTHLSDENSCVGIQKAIDLCVNIDFWKGLVMLLNWIPTLCKVQSSV